MVELPNLQLIEERAIQRFQKTFGEGEVPEFELCTHLQLFGSTTGMFPGVGGQMMTSFYITVVYEESKNVVYVFQTDAYVGGFENNYDVKKFWYDVMRHNIEHLGRYRNKDNSNKGNIDE